MAADVTGARLMGMDPEKVAYLMEAGRFLGQARSELISSGARIRSVSRSSSGPRRASSRWSTGTQRGPASAPGCAAACEHDPGKRPGEQTHTLPADRLAPSLVSPQVTSGTSQTGESLGRTTASGTAASAK